MVLSASRWLALTHPESNCDTRPGFMGFPFLLSIPQSCCCCPCVMPHPASQLQSNVKQLSHPYLPCSVSPVRKRSLMAKKEDSSSNPLHSGSYHPCVFKCKCLDLLKMLDTSVKDQPQQCDLIHCRLIMNLAPCKVAYLQSVQFFYPMFVSV